MCGGCLHAPPHFERAIAAFDYAFPWDRAIAAFKFRGHLEWAGPLSRLLAEAAQEAMAEVDILTAVPLAAQRLQERGYNQAWEIATREWAFLPSEEDQPQLSFDPAMLDPQQRLPVISE